MDETPVEQTETLIIGAGMSGLATAAALNDRGHDDFLVLEARSRDRRLLQDRQTPAASSGIIPGTSFISSIRTSNSTCARAWAINVFVPCTTPILHRLSRASRIDFPFQKNIHQLAQTELIDCLYDLYFAAERAGARSASPPRAASKTCCTRVSAADLSRSFSCPTMRSSTHAISASSISDAMGRFFPYASLTEIVRNMREPDNSSYNATFTYPEGGAIEYVNALERGARRRASRSTSAARAIDLERRVARTSRRRAAVRAPDLERARSSASSRCTGLDHDEAAFSWNKVLVFNLGFDRKGPKDVHWMYYPSREVVFYRVGFYDNIFDAERMSLYVEIGLRAGAPVDVAGLRARVLSDLRKVGLIDGHELVAEHSHRDGSGLRSHYPTRQRRGGARARTARRPRRLQHRSLWRMDVLFDRRQHRRSTRVGQRAGRLTAGCRARLLPRARCSR